MEQQTKKYSKATLETFSRMFYNYMSDLVGDSEDKKDVNGFGIIKDLELEKQFADLNIINKNEIIKIMAALEKNITKRKTLITNLEAEVAAKWKKGTTVNEVEITNCGNYYIGNFIYDGTLNKAYVVWDKNGNVAMSGMQGKIFPLDNNNFILLNSYNYLYRAEEKIYLGFYWNGNNKRRKTYGMYV